jgi:hypothetical protein
VWLTDDGEREHWPGRDDLLDGLLMAATVCVWGAPAGETDVTDPCVVTTSSPMRIEMF